MRDDLIFFLLFIISLQVIIQLVQVKSSWLKCERETIEAKLLSRGNDNDEDEKSYILIKLQIYNILINASYIQSSTQIDINIIERERERKKERKKKNFWLIY